MKQLFVLLHIIVVSATLSAQQTWTLEQCTSYGLENNLSIQQMQGETDKLHIREQTLKNSRLPSSEIAASQRFNFGRSLNRENVYQDVSSHITNLNLNVEMPLFDGFFTRNSIRENRSNMHASEENIAAKKDELRLNIANLFYRAAIYKEMHSIAVEQKKLTESQISRIQVRLKAGMTSKDLLLQMKAQLADDELKITETQGNMNIALIELAQLMNLTEQIPQFDIAVDTVDVILSDFLSDGDIQTSHFSQIRSVQHRLQSAEWAFKKVSAGYLPSLSLGGSIGSSNYIQSGVSNSAFFTQLKNNRQTYVYVALRIPLFDKFTTRDNLRSIKTDIRNQSLALQEAQNRLRTEALKIESDIQNARQKLTAATQSVNSHAEAFRFATEKFNAGKLSVYEHLQAKQRLASSQSQAVQAKYDLMYKAMIYRYYHKSQDGQ